MEVTSGRDEVHAALRLAYTVDCIVHMYAHWYMHVLRNLELEKAAKCAKRRRKVSTDSSKFLPV